MSKRKLTKGLRQNNFDVVAKIGSARRTWAIPKNICFPNTEGMENDLQPSARMSADI